MDGNMTMHLAWSTVYEEIKHDNWMTKVNKCVYRKSVMYINEIMFMYARYTAVDSLQNIHITVIIWLDGQLEMRNCSEYSNFCV